MEKILSKKVLMPELFYDLIYVFAIQKVTKMLHHLRNGHIPPDIYLKFMVVCTVILLLWFNQTIYINKYGTNSYYDIIGMFIHMFGAIYISNNISSEWSEVFVPFNVTAILMTLSIMLQYYLRSRELGKIPKAIKVQMNILGLEIIALIIALILGPKYGLIVGSAAYLAAMFLPSLFLQGEKVEINLNFPHLVERVSLITIIIFGEMVVNLAEIFHHNQTGIMSVILFLTAVLLFGTYVLQIEKIIEHYQITRGFTLLYSHIGIFIGLSTVTASFVLMNNHEVDWKFMIFFRSAGLLVFYVSLFITSVYNKENYKLKIKEVMIYTVCFIIGSIVSGFSGAGNTFMFNLGSLITALSIFGYMFSIVKKRVV